MWGAAAGVGCTHHMILASHIATAPLLVEGVIIKWDECVEALRSELVTNQVGDGFAGTPEPSCTTHSRHCKLNKYGSRALPGKHMGLLDRAVLWAKELYLFDSLAFITCSSVGCCNSSSSACYC